MSTNFIEDFMQTIDFIEKNDNFNQLEKIVESFSYGDNSQQTYMSFQLQVISLLGMDYTPPLLHFFKSPPNELDIDVKKISGKKRTILTKITNLKMLVNVKINFAEEAISSPFKISQHMFSFNHELPYHLTTTFTRNDGESIKFLMTLNDGLELINSLVVNLNEKFDKGKNNINRNLVYSLNENIEHLNAKMERLFADEDK